MKKKIVLAAPERLWLKHVIEELEEAGFEVIFCKHADEVIKEVATPNCVGLIIDQVLAPGLSETFSLDETSQGTRTGEIVAWYLEEKQPALPIVLFAPMPHRVDAPSKVKVISMMDLEPRKVVAYANAFKPLSEAK